MGTTKGRARGALVLTGLLLVQGTAWATAGHSGKVDKKVEQLKQELTLTDDQAQQIRQILEADKPSDVKKDDRAAKHDWKHQQDEKIMAVLNDTQKARYQDMQEEHRKEKHEKKHKDEPSQQHKDQGNAGSN